MLEKLGSIFLRAFDHKPASGMFQGQSSSSETEMLGIRENFASVQKLV
jgi:hypothetical protein